MRTWLTEEFGLSVPVVGAPMAGPGEGALAAAVSAAGGLGMVGVNASRSAEWVSRQAGIAGADGHRFGIGLMAWALESNPEQLAATLASGASVVSVSFGDFEPHVRTLKDAGMTVTTQAGNLAEALAAERCSVDFLVVRGAVGAWVGTAFLGCREAGNSSEARQRLFAATDTGTSYGAVFDVAQRLDWTGEYGGRALRNRYFDTWSDHLDQLAQDQAAHDELKTAREQGDYDTAYLYAGQGVGLLESERSVADVLDEFAAAEELLKRF